MDSKNVGKKIRYLRTKEGMTLDQLAQVLDIKKNMLSNYELGKNSISADLLTKIADYFGTSLDYLTSRNMLETLNESDSISNTVEIPVYATLYSDVINDEINNNEIIYSLTLPKQYCYNGNYFGLIISDDSLNLKSLNKGSVAIVREQKLAKSGELVVYSYGEKYGLYGIYHLHDDNIVISPASSNNSYMPLTYNAKDNQFKIIGKIAMMFGHIES